MFGNDTTNGFQILAFYDGRVGSDYYYDPLGGSVEPSKVYGVITCTAISIEAAP